MFIGNGRGYSTQYSYGCLGWIDVRLYWRIVLAGVIPGILIAGSQMLEVYVFAKIYNYPIYARSSFKEFFVAIFHAIPPLMTPVIIVGGIVGGVFTPTEASVIAVLYSVVLGSLFYRTIGLHNLPSILYNSGKFAAMSLFCIGTASAFGWILAYFKIPLAVVEVLAPYGVGPTSTGLIVAASFLLIGMFIDAIPAIIILGTVLWPLAEVSHMHPIHFAIIGVISLAFGLVTPPYGLCLLIACKVGDIQVKEALRDVAIVLCPMFLVLLIVIFFPELILALPKLLMAKFI